MRKASQATGNTNLNDFCFTKILTVETFNGNFERILWFLIVSHFFKTFSIMMKYWGIFSLLELYTASKQFVILIWHMYYFKNFPKDTDRYLKSDTSKSIIHVIEQISFKVYRLYPADIIWKNLQWRTSIYSNEFDFLFIKPCVKWRVKKKKSWWKHSFMNQLGSHINRCITTV